MTDVTPTRTETHVVKTSRRAQMTESEILTSVSQEDRREVYDAIDMTVYDCRSEGRAEQ